MRIKALLLCTLATIFITTAYTASTIRIRDLKLYVDGRQFIIKGFPYNPVPEGYISIKLDNSGGGGLCSERLWPPYGQRLTGCFGHDFANGVRNPAGEPWFKQVWDRDFPIMRMLGANTIRLFNWTPFSKTFFRMFPDAIPNARSTDMAAEHNQFLDAAAAAGLKVIVPVTSDETLLRTTPDDILDKMARAVVEEAGNHTATLMYLVGNEINVCGDTEIRDIINKQMDRVRYYQLTRWNRFIPVSTTLVDLPNCYETLFQELHVDIMSTNAGYRDLNHKPLWEGEGVFPGMTTLTRRYNKPIWIPEFGMHQVNNSVNYARPYWWNGTWKEIIYGISIGGSVGGGSYVFSDEPWKAAPDQQHLGAITLVPRNDPNNPGKTSLDAGVYIADDWIQKDILFDAIRQGYPGDYQRYHWNANQFELAGITQSILPDAGPEPTPVPPPPVQPPRTPSSLIPPKPSNPKPNPGTSTVDPNPNPKPQVSTPGTPQQSQNIPAPPVNSAAVISASALAVLAWILI